MKEPDQKPSEAKKAEPEFAAYVAIDWADQKHYWSLAVDGSSRIERGVVENTPEAIEVWVMELRQRCGAKPIAVSLELRRGALVAMLSKYGQLHLYPVHPLTLSKYREAWYPSRSKNDVKDADLLLELVRCHRDRLRGIDPDTDEMRLLRCQVENRRKLVDERTAISNRLTDGLKVYFPQVVRWFDVQSALVGELLRKWPTLEELQKAKPSTLQKFFQQHRYGDEEKIQDRLEQIRQAIPATQDQAVIRSSSTMAPLWAGQIGLLSEGIRDLEKEIRELARKQEDWFIFESLPGAGESMAPRLMVAMGSHRERFESAEEVQCYSGIAPVKEASGRTEWVHMRWACSKFLRQTFHEWAGCSIRFCGWAKAYYEEQLAKDKKHHAAVRALAFKWIRILYRCWVNREPYQEEKYLASLAKRNPSLQRLAKAVQAS